MTILPWFAKLNTREFEKIRHSRNFVPAKFNTFKVLIIIHNLCMIRIAKKPEDFSTINARNWIIHNTVNIR